MTKHRALFCGAAAVGTMLAPAAIAQAQGPAAAQPAAQTAPMGPALAEVVVTARRREENLQKVPVAVTVYTAKTIEQKGIVDKTSLADFTPSLITITGGYPSEYALFALRGQGPAFGVVPGTIPYFADVANPISIEGREGSYYDLASVQVLAGPQGTLFGKNATGGNILFEPVRPTNQFGGYIQGEGGNYEDERLEGAVNVPIVDDKVLLRIAGSQGRRDGYTTDVGPYFPGKQYDNLNYDSIRASLIVRPTDRFELYTVARYYYSDDNGPGTVLQQLNPATVATYGAFFPGLANAVATQQALGPRHVSYDLDEFSKTTYWQVLNQATYDISSTLKLINIASYSQFRTYYAYDYDATPYQLAGQSSSSFPVDAPNYFTEELRLQGAAMDSALNYTLGAYYDNQGWKTPDGIQAYYQLPIDIFLGPISALYDVTNSSTAVFGQATLDVGHEIAALRGLSVTGGLRYTWERSSESVEILAPPAEGGKVQSQYPSYTFDIDEALTQQVHAYLAIRDAYKSGGVNAGIPTTSAYATFPPEKLQDYEIGLKTDFAVGGAPARVNVDAYLGDYTNIQRTVEQDVSGIILNVDEDVAKARIEGVEFTGAIEPVNGLTLDAAYSYMNSRYTQIAPSAVAALSGAPFPYTPANKLSVGLNYAMDLGDRLGRLTLSGDFTYQSKFSTAQSNAVRVAYLPGYDYVNLNADLANIDGKPIDVDFFVDNLFNAVYATGLQDMYYTSPAGTVTYTFAPPRMYGIRLRYRFGS